MTRRSTAITSFMVLASALVAGITAMPARAGDKVPGFAPRSIDVRVTQKQPGTASVSLRYGVALLKEGWIRVPVVSGTFVVRDHGVDSGTIHMPNRVVGEGSVEGLKRMQYDAVIEGPGLRTVTVDLEVPVSSVGKAKALSVGLPRCPTGRLVFQSTGDRYLLRLTGEPATFEPRESSPGVYETQIPIGPRSTLSLAWEPATTEAVMAAAATTATLDVVTYAQVRLEPLRSQVEVWMRPSTWSHRDRDLAIALPKDVRLRGLSDEGGRALPWRLSREASGRVLRPIRPRAAYGKVVVLRYIMDHPGLRDMLAPPIVVYALPRIVGATAQRCAVVLRNGKGFSVVGEPLEGKTGRDREVLVGLPDAFRDAPHEPLQFFRDGRGPLEVKAYVTFERHRPQAAVLRAIGALSVQEETGWFHHRVRYRFDNDVSDPFEFRMPRSWYVVGVKVDGTPIDGIGKQIVAERKLLVPACRTGEAVIVEIEAVEFVPADNLSGRLRMELPTYDSTARDLFTRWCIDTPTGQRLVAADSGYFKAAAELREDANLRSVLRAGGAHDAAMMGFPAVSPGCVRTAFYGTGHSLTSDINLNIQLVSRTTEDFFTLFYFTTGFLVAAGLLLANHPAANYVYIGAFVTFLGSLVNPSFFAGGHLVFLEYFSVGLFTAGLAGLVYLAVKRDAYLGEL